MDEDRIGSMQQKLTGFVRDYESFLKELRSSDMLAENAALKKDLQEHRKKLDELEKSLKKISEENSFLKVSLREQILDEKLNIIKISQHKLEAYFKSAKADYQNSLVAVEGTANRKARELKSLAERELGQYKGEYIARANALAAEMQEKVRLLREHLADEDRAALKEMKVSLESLAAEEISEDLIRERARQNEIELKIGLSFANKAGILLILFGVAAAFRYTYVTWFNDYMKGAAFFLLGALMLAGGEWAYRKGKRRFATGLLGGGLAVLYISVFYSHFLLGIIDILVAAALAVAVTATAVSLSLRYNSRAICSLGLIGGYLPLISYAASMGLDRIDFNSAMAYLFVLNLFIVLVSFFRNWDEVRYLSFLFNVPSQGFLLYSLEGEPVGVLFALLTFFMYLAITLAYPLRKKLSLRIVDIALLAVNTVYSAILLYGVLGEVGMEYLRGALAVLFCLSYTGLGLFAQKRMPRELAAAGLFYATALTFAVLAVPFQLGMEWMSLGWLVEGALLIIFGFRNRLRKMELAGWVVLVLSLAAFYGRDLLTALGQRSAWDFHVKYFAVTAGLVCIVTTYLIGRKKGLDGIAGISIDYVKYFTLANLWVYLLYSGLSLYDRLAPPNPQFALYRAILAALLTFGSGVLFSGISLYYDRIVRIMTAFLLGMGSLYTIYINITIPALSAASPHTTAEYIALCLLASYNLLVLAAVRRVSIAAIRARGIGLENYPLFMGIYLLGVVTVFIIWQLRVSVASLTFSIAWLGLAILFVAYGMKKGFAYIRRLGLGLALFSTGKLLLIDLSFLDTPSKIAAYFCFGVILVGISYLYQRMEKPGKGVQH